VVIVQTFKLEISGISLRLDLTGIRVVHRDPATAATPASFHGSDPFKYDIRSPHANIEEWEANKEKLRRKASLQSQATAAKGRRPELVVQLKVQLSTVRVCHSNFLGVYLLCGLRNR
jgi:hypothetical protein